jgi:HEAT repeat protein
VDAPPKPREQAWTVLKEGLDSPKASQRAPAVGALSLMQGDRRATEAALHAIDDKDGHVRAAAATTLGQLRAETAIPALRGALKDREIRVVLAATHSLLLMKDKSAYEVYYSILVGKRKDSDGLVQSQLKRLKDPKELAQMGFDEGMNFVPFGGMVYEAYRQIHSSRGAQVRALAARFLARDPNQDSEDALMQAALEDKSEAVRLAAIDALAERGDAHCIAQLSVNFLDKKPAVRYRTAAAVLHLSRAQSSEKKAEAYKRDLKPGSKPTQ